MKYILTFTILMANNLAFGQSDIPVFSEGTWKMENKETCEHWDKLNHKTLKGLAYEL